jgi:hypothetical protein
MIGPTQAKACRYGCRAPVPPELGVENLCVLHFTLGVEQDCTAIRRELVQARSSREREAEIARLVTLHALRLARVATGSNPLPDEMKNRILSTFSTLMVLKESLDRFAARAAGPQSARSLRISPLRSIA